MKNLIAFLLLFWLALGLPASLFAEGEKPVATATLTGLMQYDYNGNCIFDGNDFNYSISLRFVGSSGTFIATSGSSPNEFSVNLNDNDTYLMEMAFPYPYQFCPSVQTTIVVPAGTTSLDLGSVLYAPISFCTISGIVYQDLDNDCVIGPDEGPMEGYEVCIFGEIPMIVGGINFSAITDANGFYSIQVPCGDYYFSCMPNPNSCPQCPNIAEYVEQNTTIDLSVYCPFPGNITGVLFIDADLDCVNSGETPLQGWTVAATIPGSGDTTFAQTDATGIYLLNLADGLYEVQVLDPTGLWQSCTNPQMIAVASTTVSADFPMQEQGDCYYLTAEIGTSTVAPCLLSPWNIQFCNQGTNTAQSAYLVVTLDPQLTYSSSTLPASSVNGNAYTFQLGDLLPGQCGAFTIFATLSCDAIIGEAICSDVHIFPDDNCTAPSQLWSGANIEVEANCMGGSQVNFTLKNSGTGDMTGPLPFVVIEDNVLVMPLPGDGMFQLDAGQSLSVNFPANGKTFISQAPQAPFHPSGTLSVAWSEGCGVNPTGSFSVGYVAQYAFGDEEPFFDIECQEVVAPFDPNIKQAFPKGITDQHFIEPTTALEYQILFQNTGTGPAAKVVVRDTLPAELDPTTLRPGIGSHPYIFSMQSGNVAVFTFNNINLPPESTNPIGSIGYLKFNIAQSAGNQSGTIIENKAAIYFDNNPPIITPPYIHRIPFPEITQATAVQLCEGETYEGLVITADTNLQRTVNYLFFDSIFITEIQVWPSANGEVAQTLCPGESLTVNGTVYDEANPTGTEVLHNASWHGCDSTVKITLSYFPAAASEIAETLCFGSSLTVNGTVYDEANPTGTEFFTAVNGCDSTVQVSLSFSGAVVGQLAQSLCPGEFLSINGTVYDEANPVGEVFFPNGSWQGCDSTVQVTLGFWPSANGEVVQTLCPGESLMVNGKVYDETNPTGTEVLPGASWHGCDSVLTVALTFLQTSGSSFAAKICEGDIYVFGNEELSQSGIYSLSLPSENGCDSLVELTLEVLPVVTNNLMTEALPGETVFGVTVWSDTVFSQTLLGETQCEMQTIIVTILVGTEEEKGAPLQFSIHPNPASERLFVSFQQRLPEGAQLQVFDLQGRKIQQKQAFSEGVMLSVGELWPGMYFLVLVLDGKVLERQRFVKE